jgi:hypothetical protein
MENEMNLIKANVVYLLDTLAGYEPDDIEQDEFEVAVNDDQFGQCSIVELADVSSAKIRELEVRLHRLSGILHGDVMYEYSDIEEMRELCNTEKELKALKT